MRITPEIEQWLKRAGYEHLCFISYPRIPDSEETLKCAENIRERILADLSVVTDKPSVYLDTRMSGGANWRKELKRALCRSITMVAVCSPMYYHPAHKWCGLEWAAMTRLGDTRLRKQDFHAIIPLIYRDPLNLPEPVASIQYIDISRASLMGRTFYQRHEFRAVIREVSDRIVQTAVAIADNQVVTNCEHFRFPSTPAFGHLKPAARPNSLW